MIPNNTQQQCGRLSPLFPPPPQNDGAIRTFSSGSAAGGKFQHFRSILKRFSIRIKQKRDKQSPKRDFRLSHFCSPENRIVPSRYNYCPEKTLLNLNISEQVKCSEEKKRENTSFMSQLLCPNFYARSRGEAQLQCKPESGIAAPFVTNILLWLVDQLIRVTRIRNRS